MTLGEAIEELIRQYDKACAQSWVINPLAYALFQTWKQADNSRTEREHAKR